MKQAALALTLSVKKKVKKPLKREFLEQMEQVVSWAVLVELIALFDPESRTGSRNTNSLRQCWLPVMRDWFGAVDDSRWAAQ